MTVNGRNEFSTYQHRHNHHHILKIKHIFVYNYFDDDMATDFDPHNISEGKDNDELIY